MSIEEDQKEICEQAKKEIYVQAQQAFYEGRYDGLTDLLLPLAEAGMTEAQSLLGVCYFEGKGVQQNSEKAVGWFKKSAAQGSAKAQSNLGFCYTEGWGVEQNFRKAHDVFLSIENGRELKLDGLEYLKIKISEGITKNLGNMLSEEFDYTLSFGDLGKVLDEVRVSIVAVEHYNSPLIIAEKNKSIIQPTSP